MFISKYIVFAVFFLIFSNCLFGQVFPEEGRVLNYRIIGFTTTEEETKECVLEIAEGVHNDEASFKRHLIKSERSASPNIVAEVPYFGKQYTWRIISGKPGKISKFYHFGTGMAVGVDTNIFRLRILSQVGGEQKSYVFIEEAGVLYDLKGNPVWFLPGNTSDGVTDLKMSSAGTITFLSGGVAYEVNYDGDTLWSAGSKEMTEYGADFHHDFKRLDNGHYMVLDHSYRYRELPSFAGIVAKSKSDSDRYYHKIKYDILREYDVAGSIFWEWNSAKYFFESDLSDIGNSDAKAEEDILHINSFFFDLHNSCIYLSSKTTSRIIKIKYPEGNVLANYGKKYAGGFVSVSEGSAMMANDLFFGQHSCRVNNAGNLYLYNNNARPGIQQLPEIAEMRELDAVKGILKEVWRYKCTVDDTTINFRAGRAFRTGGNVEDLSMGNYFVSMSAPYSKLFVVGHDKNVLWSALPEKWSNEERKWMLMTVYRASMIAHQADLEKMLFYRKQ